MSWRNYVLEALACGDYRVTLHAKQRMAQRNISHADIRCCGETGIVYDQSDGTVEVLGVDLDEEELKVVCAEENGIIIVTIY